MTPACAYTCDVPAYAWWGTVTRARTRGVGAQGFKSVDPLAPSYPELSTYQFASNSPISGIDMDGLEYHPGIEERAENGMTFTIMASDNVGMDRRRNLLTVEAQMRIRSETKPIPTPQISPARTGPQGPTAEISRQLYETSPYWGPMMFSGGSALLVRGSAFFADGASQYGLLGIRGEDFATNYNFLSGATAFGLGHRPIMSGAMSGGLSFTIRDGFERSFSGAVIGGSVGALFRGRDFIASRATGGRGLMTTLNSSFQPYANSSRVVGLQFGTEVVEVALPSIVPAAEAVDAAFQAMIGETLDQIRQSNERREIFDSAATDTEVQIPGLSQ